MEICNTFKYLNFLKKTMDKTIAKNRKNIISVIIANANHISLKIPDYGSNGNHIVTQIPNLMLMYSITLLTMSRNGHCQFFVINKLICTFKVPDSVVGMVFK